ncbi:MAG: hypothetical protein JWN26_529 [Candidatus Saccharibacteria bacterium]|nr:hypothetical protein [Candidatus Saccharibacteria bacterium]
MTEILPIENNTGRYNLDNARTFVRLRADVLMNEGVSRARLNAYDIDDENRVDQYRQARLQAAAILEEEHDFLGAFQDGVMIGAVEKRPWTHKDELPYFSLFDRYVARKVTLLGSDQAKPQPIGIFALLAEKTDKQTEVFESLLDHVTKDQDKNDFLLPLTAHHPALLVAAEYGFESTGKFARQFGALHELYIREGEAPTSTESAA